jgi:hypothetical protein
MKVTQNMLKQVKQINKNNLYKNSIKNFAVCKVDNPYTLDVSDFLI